MDRYRARQSSQGGPTDTDTDTDNGCCQCPRHHRLLHRGYRLEGDPNSQLRFYRPDGTCLGAPYPAPTRQPVGL